MKNVIFITIDTLSYESLYSYPNKEELFMFNVLSKHSISFSNMFSQAPFTEGSMNSMLCGEKGLECSSFLYGSSKCGKNIFDVFFDNGYETFNATVDSATFARSLTSSNEVSPFCYAGAGDEINILFAYRLNHFIDMYNKNGFLSNEVYNAVSVLIEDALMSSYDYYDSIIRSDKKTHFVNSKYNIDDCKLYLTKISNEIKLLKENNNKYGENILLHNGEELKTLEESRPKSHTIFTEDYIYKNQNTLNKVGKKIEKMQLRSLKKIKGNFRTFVNLINFKNIRNYGLYNYAKNIYKFFFYGDGTSYYKGKKSLCRQISSFSYADHNCFPSVKTILDFLESKIDNYLTQSKPFFIYAQVQDFHPPSTYWTYDQENQSLFNNEMNYVHRLTKDAAIKKFKGNFLDMLSICYLDKKLKDFYTSLSTKTDMNDILFIIAADHGNWNGCFAKRNINPIDTILKERIHIPFIIHNPRISYRKVGDLLNSYNIPFIVESFAFGIEEKAIEKTIKKEQFVISESFGFGCPDMSSKKMVFVVHNDSYYAIFSFFLSDQIDINNLDHFWCLDIDPLLEQDISRKVVEKEYGRIFKEMAKLVIRRKGELMLYYKNNSFWSFKK